MDHYEVPQSALTIALHGELYLGFIMDRYGGPHNVLTMVLHGDLNLRNKKERYGAPHVAHNIWLQEAFILPLKRTVMDGPTLRLLQLCMEASTLPI
jgi:hypothetical protein